MRSPAQPTPPPQHPRHLIGLLRNGLRFDTASVLDEPIVLFANMAGSRSMSPREVPAIGDLPVDLVEVFHFHEGARRRHAVLAAELDQTARHYSGSASLRSTPRGYGWRSSTAPVAGADYSPWVVAITTMLAGCVQH